MQSDRAKKQKKPYSETKIDTNDLTELAAKEQAATKKVIQFVYDAEWASNRSITTVNFPKHVGWTEKEFSTVFSQIKTGHRYVNKEQKQILLNFINNSVNLKNAIEKDPNMTEAFNLFKEHKDVNLYHQAYIVNPEKNIPTSYKLSDLILTEQKRDNIIRPIITLLMQELKCKATTLDAMMSSSGKASGRISGYVNRRIHNDGVNFRPQIFPKNKEQELLDLLERKEWQKGDSTHRNHYNELAKLIQPSLAQNDTQHEATKAETSLPMEAVTSGAFTEIEENELPSSVIMAEPVELDDLTVVDGPKVGTKRSLNDTLNNPPAKKQIQENSLSSLITKFNTYTPQESYTSRVPQLFFGATQKTPTISMSNNSMERDEAHEVIVLDKVSTYKK